ncbi:unnamed protein product, partial [Vitis vinifera]
MFYPDSPSTTDGLDPCSSASPGSTPAKTLLSSPPSISKSTSTPPPSPPAGGLLSLSGRSTPCSDPLLSGAVGQSPKFVSDTAQIGRSLSPLTGARILRFFQSRAVQMLLMHQWLE